MKILNKVVSIILDILFISIIIGLIKLGIIPDKFILIIGILLTIIGFILTILSFKIKNIIGNIFILIILLISIVGCIISINYINNTNNFFTNIKEVEEKSTYYVIVNSSSNYLKLNDINNKNIGMLEIKNNSYKKAIDIIKNKIKINEKIYDNTTNIIKDLYNNNIESIILNSNNYDLLKENDETFKDKTRIIETININEVKKVKEEQKEEENIKDSFNILVSGIDTYGSINKVSRSDVNIIISVNPTNHKILLTTIPRDYYVKLHTYQAYDKLTHAGIYGIDESRQTIEDLLDTKIDYYIRVNFDSLVNLVDTIGGVDIYSNISSRYGSNYYLNVGNNHMNGKQALAFSRERKKFAGGDRDRGRHQEQVIEAIINKISTSSVLLTNYNNILSSLSNLMQTNISDNKLKSLVKEQLEHMSAWDIKSINVDGYNSHGYTYSMPGWDLWIMRPNENSINNAKEEIKNILEN